VYVAVGVALIAFVVACSSSPRQPTSEEKWRRAQLVASVLGNENRFADWKVSDFDQWYCWPETDWHAQLPVYGGSGPWDVMAHAVIACPTRSLGKLAPALKELFPEVDPEQIDTAVADAIAATRTIGP
jgi:hypothetical protein